MRVAGTRTDGALWLLLDGGMAVILRADRCSPPVDPALAQRLGPWADAHGVSGSDRRELARRLDLARTAPLDWFALDTRKVRVSTVHGKKKLKFEYETDDGKTIGDEPTDEPALDEEQADEAEPDAEDDEDADILMPGEDAEEKKKGLPAKIVTLDKDEHGYGSDPRGGGGGEKDPKAQAAHASGAEAHRAAASAHRGAAVGNVSSSAADKATREAAKASDKAAAGTAMIKRPDGLREPNRETSAGKAHVAAWQARESEKRMQGARGPNAAQSAMASRAKYHEEAATHHEAQASAHDEHAK